MCIVCASSSSFNLECSEADPVYQETTNEFDQAIPSELEPVYNTLNKVSKTTEEAGEHITRSDIKYDDDAAYGGNGLGEAASLTYGYTSTNFITNDNGITNVAVSAVQKIYVEKAIAEIESIANITFTYVENSGSGGADPSQLDIQSIPNYAGGYAAPTFGWEAENGNPTEATQSLVAIGSADVYNTDQEYGFSLTLHEIGHAIGLSHPGDYNGASADTYATEAEYFQDTEQYSVMSYWDENNSGADHYAYAFTGAGYEWVGGEHTGYMLHDIAALQRLYGANMTTRTGDTVYGFNSNTGDSTWTLDSAADSIIAAVWDAGGIDTIDTSGFYEDAVIDLREEAFSSFGGLTYNFAIAKGVTIENAIGGHGDDQILGNDAANTLLGNDGDDQLDGGAGSDIISGGAGDDTIVYDAADTFANITGGAGTDTLFFREIEKSVFETLLITLDLTAQGFEQAAVVYMDTANEIWFNIWNIYDASYQHTNTTINLDNNIKLRTEYDVDNSDAWDARLTIHDSTQTDASGDALQLAEYTYTGTVTGPTTADDAGTVSNQDANNYTTSGSLFANDIGTGLVLISVGVETIVGSIADAQGVVKTITGQYGTLTINADNTWQYVLDATNASVTALAMDETLTESFDYIAANSEGADESTLTLTINGPSSTLPPVAVADLATATEDSVIEVSGDLFTNDTGNTPDALTVNSTTVTGMGLVQIVGTYGTLDMDEAGTWVYILDDSNSAVDALNDGETLTDTFDYTSTNAAGSSSSTLTITINGTTDGPIVITGTSGNDTLTGTDGNDILLGLDGTDSLFGGDGDDILDAGANS
ncbi:MAG: M10 family metallopeptidase C-terminal domain-containing protein, partial [Rhizobiales bacterium]|nr:M10 family metallopeptidase C-terminal domain-containing protein [Hyphomicrobiales bacterium]